MGGIRDEYIKFFEEPVDNALSGVPQRIMFCDDVVLELYLDNDGMLHWRRVDGNGAGDEGRDGET